MRRCLSVLRLLVAAALCGVGTGLPFGLTRPAAAKPRNVSVTKVIVRTMRAPQGQPSFGTQVSVHQGRRVYVNPRDGFTLLDLHEGLVPARTTDAGMTWRVDGPSLYIPGAADSANTIEDFDAQSPTLIYAYGGGNVVDVTNDGGRVWRQAIFEGLQAGVLPVRHGLLAYVEDFSTGRSQHTTIRRFLTTDGGRSWHLVRG